MIVRVGEKSIAGSVFHVSRFAQADGAGADGSANVLRPLCGLLLNLAAPSAPASSAIAFRKHFEKRLLSVSQFLYVLELYPAL